MTLSQYKQWFMDDYVGQRLNKNKANSKPNKANYINITTPKGVERMSEMIGKMMIDNIWLFGVFDIRSQQMSYFADLA